MALTLAEAVAELERFKHERAVWMEVIEHISRAVDREGRQAFQGIAAEGCAVNPVPQTVVQSFIDRINGEEIDPLNVKIAKLEGLNVEETTDDEGDGVPKEKSSKKKSSPKGKKGSQKGAPRPRRLRTVPKPEGGGGGAARGKKDAGSAS